MAFELPPLPYAYDALEPHVDEATMRVHHDKHHAGYTTNLNAAIEGTDLANLSIEEILGKGVDALPTAVRNNGGGYANHVLFWQVMSPDGGGAPSGALAAAIFLALKLVGKATFVKWVGSGIHGNPGDVGSKGWWGVIFSQGQQGPVAAVKG